MNRSLTSSALVAALALGASAGGADAAQPQIASQATNFCQSALPAYDGLIRKRPLAVQNEGSNNAFVTCSYPSAEGRTLENQSSTTMVYQYFLNNSAAPITISCTGVAGNVSATAQYIPKEITVPANSTSGEIIWNASDFSGAPSVFPAQSLFSISCVLPPGGGLRNGYVTGIATP